MEVFAGKATAEASLFGREGLSMKGTEGGSPTGELAGSELRACHPCALPCLSNLLL